VNALDPNIKKGPWSKEDDRKLLEYVEQFGKGKFMYKVRSVSL